MRRTTIIGAAMVAAAALIVFTFLALSGGEPAPASSVPASTTPADPSSALEVRPDVLYGRITTTDGETHEGRLRWGVDQEAFWGDLFDGLKSDNHWADHAPQERPATKRRKIEIFGVEIGGEDRSIYRRLFMARFGDIVRIDAQVRDVQVTLKSRTRFVLDRFAAGDIDDGVRVWDGTGGAIDLDSRRIRAIEFLPAPPTVTAPGRLYGTVRTRQSSFTGFIQWNQQDGFISDELEGRTVDGDVSFPYGTIRSVARRSPDSALVTLVDGREVVLSGSRESGRNNRGIYVEDRRYGRVLVSWNAFDRVDFSRGDGAPSYDDFPAGRALVGSVMTRDGRRLAGRLVYDFDETETTETLDVLVDGVDYNIPFGLISAVLPGGGEGKDPQRARVILHDGKALQFERAGDLGDGNAGILIFVNGGGQPDYVRWLDVARIDFDPPGSK